MQAKQVCTFSFSYPVTKLDRPLGFHEVEGPRISRQWAYKCGTVSLYLVEINLNTPFRIKPSFSEYTKNKLDYTLPAQFSTKTKVFLSRGVTFAEGIGGKTLSSTYKLPLC
jgi:hypothetical protein